MSRDDAALLRLLHDADVPFVVIGGWAVITHGFIRFTKDVDVLIPDRPGVLAMIAELMAGIHAQRLNGQPVTARDVMPDQGWQLDTDLGRIDFLLEGEPPLDFAGVRDGGLDTEMQGVPIRVAGLAHLAAFKRLAGRLSDRVDLEMLEELTGEPLPHLDLPGIDD